jgi:hypothetical protein
MLKNGTERATSPPDRRMIWETRHTRPGTQTPLRFAGIVALVIVLGGLLLFFDNISVSSLGKPKGPACWTGRAPKYPISATREAEDPRGIRGAIAKDHIDEARVDSEPPPGDSSPEAHFLPARSICVGQHQGPYDHLKEAPPEERLRRGPQQAREIYVMWGIQIRNLDGNLLSQKARFSRGRPVAGIGNRPSDRELDLAAQKAERPLSRPQPHLPQTDRLYADIHLRQGDSRNPRHGSADRSNPSRRRGYLSLGSITFAAIEGRPSPISRRP